MFEPSDTPRLFGLPPGVNFAEALVAGLIARQAAAPAEAMARVTVYLNTARMQRAVRAAFDNKGARFLPRLRLVTDLGRDPMPGLPPATPPLRRRLELAQLVMARMEKDPGFAAGAMAFDLADSLARLMDEMQGEGVPPEALEAANLAEDHAAHWERSLKFIRIVARYFVAESAPDPEARQRRVVEALINRWAADGPADPVIVAGSTGSRGATQLFMQAVARLPQGAIVLPGFDEHMSEPAWNSLYSSQIPSEDHPQFRFLQLARALEIPVGEIRRWADVAAPAPERNRLLSLALRPAPVTDQWMAEGASFDDLITTTADLTLIEAPSPRAEALAIALRLRKAAEDGQRAVLITPDRMLSRRVTAALDRWGIVPDDSAGLPLVQSAPGRFLRHVAGLFGRPLSAEALLVLLKHPLTATGAGERGNHLRFTRDLELSFRRNGPPFPTAEDLCNWAAKTEEKDRLAWATWIGRSLTGIETAEERPLSAFIETHLAVSAAIAAGPGGTVEASELWREEPGRLARRTMAELAREAAVGGQFQPREYSNLVTSLLSQGSVRQTTTVHPLIAIQGTLEARAGGADLAILAGLNEGIWPAMPAPDPWLSRQMRIKAGLLLPERQIGLSAHDFQQAAGAPQVVLSRAIRDEEAETVASRWLARLTNLLHGLPDQGGAAALNAMRDRGAEWLSLAQRLDQPEKALTPAHRPAPRPPVLDRPRELPVTGVRTLIRDPYAIYARYTLDLKPLNPLRAEADARLRGTVLHRIVEGFVRNRPEAEVNASARLLELAERILTEDIPWPSARRIWLARLARIADRFTTAEAERAKRGEPIILEDKFGSISLENGSFTLTARPDRIDLLEDGRVHIYDYKTGTPPTKKQQEHFDKQLLLEAVMSEDGAFKTIGPRQVEGVTYIQLGGDAKEETTAIDADMITEIRTGLQRLVAAYRRPEIGFTARRAVFSSKFEGDYDHLARFGEWQMGDPPEPEDVG